MQAEVERNETVFWPNFPREVRPLSQCPGRCSARGMCTFLYTETARRPDIQPVCECYYGWQARLREFESKNDCPLPVHRDDTLRR